MHQLHRWEKLTYYHTNRTGFIDALILEGGGRHGGVTVHSSELKI